MSIRPAPLRRIVVLLAALLLAGCALAPQQPQDYEALQAQLPVSPKQQEIAMYALMLLETDYQFGGKNPSAGLDCSGMVTYVYRRAAGMPLSGNAAQLARQGRDVSRAELRPGDLVFFNTLHRPFSHVGIYLGHGQFIHAANERSGVRIDYLSNPYYAARFEGGRTFFD